MAEVTQLTMPLTKNEIASTSFLTSTTTLWILGLLFVFAGIVLVAVLYVPSDKNVVVTKGIPPSLTLADAGPGAIVVPEKMPIAVHENMKIQNNDLAKDLSKPKNEAVRMVDNSKHVQDIAPFEGVVQTNPLLVREKPLVTRSRMSMEDVQDLAGKMGLSVENQLQMQPLHENVESALNTVYGSKKVQKNSNVSNVDRMIAMSNTNNLHEIASLVRDMNQPVPTSNDALAAEVLRDILKAQEEASSLNVVLPNRDASQTDVLKMYAVSKKQPLCDLAKSILSRASE